MNTTDVIIFIGLLVLAYMMIHFYFKGKITMEGMENNSSNGVAGNAQTFAADVKTKAVEIKDRLLISKYRADYENVILNYDDLISGMMLEKLLENSSDKMKTLNDFVILSNAKTALNSVMKYVDAQ
jgi:hypothetical protein